MKNKSYDSEIEDKWQIFPKTYNAAKDFLITKPISRGLKTILTKYLQNRLLN